MQFESVAPLCSCSIHVLHNNNLIPSTKWRIAKYDSINYCEDVQESNWLSINCHKQLFMGTEQSCSSRHIVHYQLTWDTFTEDNDATELCRHIAYTTSTTHFSAIDYHVRKPSNGSVLLTQTPSFLIMLCKFKPIVLLVVCLL